MYLSTREAGVAPFAFVVLAELTIFLFDFLVCFDLLLFGFAAAGLLADLLLALALPLAAAGFFACAGFLVAAAFFALTAVTFFAVTLGFFSIFEAGFFAGVFFVFS